MDECFKTIGRCSQDFGFWKQGVLGVFGLEVCSRLVIGDGQLTTRSEGKAVLFGSILFVIFLLTGGKGKKFSTVGVVGRGVSEGESWEF